MKRDILGRFASTKFQSVVKYCKYLVVVLFVIGFLSGVVSTADMIHDKKQVFVNRFYPAKTVYAGGISPLATTTDLSVNGLYVAVSKIAEARTQALMRDPKYMQEIHDQIFNSQMNKISKLSTTSY